MAEADEGRRGRNAQRRVLIARRIVGIAITEAYPAGHHLVETALAEALGVSRTPVRAALAYLTELGVVTARENHGFFLARPGGALSDLEIETPRSAEEDLYVALVGAGARGEGGSRITQTDIARRMGVSSATALRVLDRLAAEGLIVRDAGHGWRYVPTLDSVQSRRASYEFRRALELAALRSCAFVADAEVLAEQRRKHVDLLRAVERDGANRSWIYATDAGFHEAVVAFSKNQFFLSAISQQNRLRRLLELWDGGNRARVAAWCREHLAIIGALEADDREAAVRLMAEHLDAAERTSRS